MSQEQIYIIIGFAVVIFVLTLIKKLVFKIISMVATVILGICLFHHFEPTLKHVELALNDKEVYSSIKSIANTSENIKLLNNSIQLKVVNTDVWIDIKDIDDIVSISENSCTIKARGKVYVIEDKTITQLLTKLKDYKK